MKKIPVRFILGMGLLVLSTQTARADWVQTNGPWGADIYALAVSGDNIFTATSSGRVYHSTNNGTSWTPVSSGLSNTTVYTFTVSGNTIFAGGTSGVFRSTNNGTSWTAETSGLSNNYIYSFCASSSSLFAGTYGGGVFRSFNNGTSWTAVNSGLTDSRVLSLAVSDGTIFAGTYHNGVWRRPLSEMIPVNNHNPRREVSQQVNFAVHAPSHADPNATIKFSLPHSDRVTVTIYSLAGHEIASLVDRRLGPGPHTLTWNTRKVSSGCYTVRMRAGANAYAKSVPVFR